MTGKYGIMAGYDMAAQHAPGSTAGLALPELHMTEYTRQSWLALGVKLAETSSNQVKSYRLSGTIPWYA